MPSTPAPVLTCSLVSCVYCSLTNDGDVAARLLTVDHNGMNEEEAARIRNQHSKFARLAAVGTMHATRYAPGAVHP